jgi:outer membrane protein
VKQRFKWVRCAVVVVLSGIAVVPAGALDLDADAFIKRVDAYSRQLELARLDVTSADAARQAARAGALPRLTASLFYGREALELSDVSQYQNTLQVSAQAQQNLFNMSVFYALRASALLDKMTGAGVEATRQQVINASRKAFYGAILAREYRAVARDSETSAADRYEQAKVRFSSGVASEFDLLQAEAAWRATTPPRLRAERDYQLAVNSLKILAGIELPEPLELKGSLEDPGDRPVPQADIGALKNRPDLAAAEWQRQLYEMNLKAAESARYPVVAATATYGRSSFPGDHLYPTLPPQDDKAYDSLQLGVVVTVPIFTGGATESAVRTARVDLQRSATRLAQLQDEARVETENTRLRLDEARQSVRAAALSVDSARRAFEIAQTRVDNRLGTQLELNQVRVVYDQARLGYYAAVYDLLSARFDWELMTGVVP